LASAGDIDDSERGCQALVETDPNALSKPSGGNFTSGSTSKDAKAREREAEKERKQALKEEKNKQKQKAAELAAVNKSRMDKKDSAIEMIVDLPSTWDTSELGNQIRSFLDALQIEHSSWSSSMPNLVKWRRKANARFNDEAGHWEPAPLEVKKENHALCFLSAEDFVNLAVVDSGAADGQDLDAHVLRLKGIFKDCSPIYLIEGLTTWMRKNRNIRNRQFQNQVMDDSTKPSANRSRGRKVPREYVDEDAVEDALLRLQVMHNCLIHHTATTTETAEWVSGFTQHISTIPYRYVDGSF
jgi:crossover junction endonuclease EME1